MPSPAVPESTASPEARERMRIRAMLSGDHAALWTSAAAAAFQARHLKPGGSGSAKIGSGAVGEAHFRLVSARRTREPLAILA
jgi:hypothetical protein